ncbi:MAG: hypothetical protein QOI83_354, partial [Streptomycetaceae bacterium]|nr:hypothetical protein [Streptomycetaceae bacterium]
MSRDGGRRQQVSESSTTRPAGRSVTAVARVGSMAVGFLPGTMGRGAGSRHPMPPGQMRPALRGVVFRRRVPYRADAAPIAALAELGLRVSQAQLERWWGRMIRLACTATPPRLNVPYAPRARPPGGERVTHLGDCAGGSVPAAPASPIVGSCSGLWADAV